MIQEDEERELPEQIMEKFKSITLFVDVMHVNGIAFLISKSAHIGHHIAVPIIHKDAEHFVKAIDEMQTEYSTRGGVVKHVIGDGAFKCIKANLSKREIKFTPCIAKKHVPQAERCIRDIKNRIRFARMRMPYKKIPKRLVIEILKLAAKLKSSLVNPFDNIHPIMSPRQLVTGIPLRLAELEIGQFVQAHTGGTSSTEKDKERTSDAIYIGRTDNGNGHEVLKMSTGQVVTVNKVTVIPVNNDHIARVNQMGALDGKCDGIVISNFYGDVTINDLDAEAGDDDSNASDNDFKFDKSDQHEWDDNKKTEDSFLLSLGSIKDEEVIGAEMEFQNDHFNRNWWIDMNADDVDNNDDNSVDEEDVNYALDEPHPNIDEDSNDDSDEDSIPKASTLLTASAQAKKKKKKANQIDKVDHDPNEDDAVTIESNDEGGDAASDDGGDNAIENNEEPEQQNDINQPNEDDEVDRANVPKELFSALGNYWETMLERRVACVYWIANLDDFVWNDCNDATSNVDRFVLSAMQSYYNSEPTPDVANIEGSHASKATPQFGFRKGMKLFGIEGWEATKKEIDENLLGIDAVKMILYKGLDCKLQKEALSYLIFLKRKRTGVVKSRGHRNEQTNKVN